MASETQTNDSTKSLRNLDSGKGLVFLHVPRTGGLTCRSILQQIYPNSFRYCKTANVTEIGESIKQLQCLEFHSGEVDGETIYFHHNIVLPENWKYFGNATVFIMFRNPIDRLISHYYQILESRNKPRVMKLFQRMGIQFPETIHDFIKLPYVHNIQVGFLSGHHFSSKKIHSSRELERAKFFLTDLKPTIGITERFGDSIRSLENAIGRSIPNRDIEIKNRHPFRDDALSLNSATREYLKEENKLDDELYQFAVQLFEKQLKLLPTLPSNDLRFYSLVNP
jgi:Sulfotransferase family.